MASCSAFIAASLSLTMSPSRCSSPRPATPPPLRPPDPAAQLGRLLARQAGGKGAVGGVEQMVALVEDDPLQRSRLTIRLLAPRRARPVERRLGQDQGVIGDDQIRAAAGADRPFRRNRCGSADRRHGRTRRADPPDWPPPPHEPPALRTGRAASRENPRPSCRRRAYAAPSARPAPGRSGRHSPAGPPAPCPAD